MSKINIGIMELYYHSRFLHTMCKICKRPYTDVTVFTTEKIWSEVTKHDINSSMYDVVLKPHFMNHRDFIEHICKICNNFNIMILFINTIRENYVYLKDYKNFNPKAKVILTIHNVNSWLGKGLHFNFSKSFHTIPYFILDSMISRQYIKKYLLPKIYAFNGIYPPLVRYISSLGFDKPVFNFPFYFHEGITITKRRDDKIVFVIPGSIDKKRKDYHMVLDVFENFTDEVMLILLGRPIASYGKSVVKRCKKMKNVVFFEDYVPEEEYHAIMSTSCDFILAEIRERSCGLGVIEEIAGKTKAFSPPFEAISHGKPLIISSRYPIDDRLKTSTFKFSNRNELKEVIDSIAEMNNIAGLKEAAKNNAKKFSLPFFQSYFDKVLKEVI